MLGYAKIKQQEKEKQEIQWSKKKPQKKHLIWISVTSEASSAKGDEKQISECVQRFWRAQRPR